MAEVIARVRKEMQERLEELEAQLANVEALIAERAQIQRALATPPFATTDPPRRARSIRPTPAAPAETAPAEPEETAPVALVEAAPVVADDVALVALDEVAEPVGEEEDLAA